ncbi:DUF2130 domain-containing protein [Spiroplasma endosymbiont of Megaselia nigra]|uniref:DUF2130 domain-containing protein n=1 Tax=Spiroplasma endosymbiont of Megaselia nigra TaxID=2478537 RepID=UPI000F883547|nr:DUF2130 domain-containing protein [Spiroplasma endosymbiont of Megaselia nigra]RUO86686.1 DUF2130 domain-containing protein [Spiroplasma endosymbiont of Megaselia nigra]
MNYKIECPYCNKEIDLSKLDVAKDKYIQEYISRQIEERLITKKLELEKENKIKLNLEYKQQEEQIKQELEIKHVKEIGELKEQLVEKKTILNTVLDQNKVHIDAIKFFETTFKELRDEMDKNYTNKLEKERKEFKEELAEKEKRIQELTNVKTKGNQSEQDFSDFLNTEFKQFGDKIERINPGQRGADIIHNVFISSDVYIQIYYEIKDVDTFIINGNKAFIPKFISDVNNKKIKYGAIIARNLPAEWIKQGTYLKAIDNNPGLFVCSFENAKVVFMLLRKLVLETERIIAEHNREKYFYTVIYNKLNSPEFKALINTINDLIKQSTYDLEDYIDSSLKYHWKLRNTNSLVIVNIQKLVAEIKFE